MPTVSFLCLLLVQTGAWHDCGLGAIPEDMDTIPWVHKVTHVPVGNGKPCADTVPYVDLSHQMPPVGNQYRQNCCTAWGFAYYHRTHVEFLEQGWDLTDPRHQGSPAFIYNQTNGGRNGSSQFSRAMAIMLDQGCGTMSDCPYDTNDWLTWPTEQAYLNALGFRADSAFWFDVHDSNFVSLIRQHLANGNTCVTGIVIYENFWDIHNYNNIYTLADMRGDPISAHAVTIVGYNDTMSTRDGYGAFRLVNSMGTAWGDSGFFWMSYQATADTRVVYGYACYVTDLIDYEPKLIGTVRLSHPTRDRVGLRFGIGPRESSVWHKDFRSWRWVQEDHPFPNQRLPFDLTDGEPFLTGTILDTIYFEAADDTLDGRSGSVRHFEARHLVRMTEATSPDPPLQIPDNGDTVSAALLLPFTGITERPRMAVSAKPHVPTVLRGPDLARPDCRVLDALGRDVTERRHVLAPGVYFVRRSGSRSVSKVIISD